MWNCVYSVDIPKSQDKGVIFGTRQLVEVIYSSTWLKLHNNALTDTVQLLQLPELAQNVFIPQQQCGQVQWPIVAHFLLARRHISVKLKITSLCFKYTLIYM